MNLQRGFVLLAMVVGLTACGGSSGQDSHAMLSVDEMTAAVKKISRQQQGYSAQGKQFITGLKSLQTQLVQRYQVLQKQVGSLHNNNVQLLKQVQNNVSNEIQALNSQVNDFGNQATTAMSQ